MPKNVAICGIGYTNFRSVTPAVSFREMIYEAATKAYEDAGVEPKEIGGFVTAVEDMIEGHAISDELAPEPLGAVKKPVHTVSADAIHGLISAYMHILTGQLDTYVVESHSKVSNICLPQEIVSLALDPIYNRPLEHSPYFIAGMEMNRYLYETGTTREQCARVVVKNRRNALDNPYAGHGAKLAIDDVLDSEMVSYPLTRLDIAPSSDGAIVMVLASEEVARALTDKPIWIKGVGWCSDTPGLETRDWADTPSTRVASEMAYKMAGIKFPRKEIDLCEIDDEFSFKELQHMESLKLCKKGEAGSLVDEGATEIGRDLPVNPSGGSLGVGHLFELTGAQKVLEVVLQLRGEAGKRQVAGARTGLAHSWRGVPTTSDAVVILSSE